jgi:hypothetical protein
LTGERITAAAFGDLTIIGARVTLAANRVKGTDHEFI